jgi:hypothetical protein
MKAILLLFAASLVSGFTTSVQEDEIDGVWMGYFRSQYIKEKMIVKFSNEAKMEFYTGGVDERTMSEGSYQMTGDSVVITCRTIDGEWITMKGEFNYRKNFVDGTWKSGNNTSGNFYLEKQKVQEWFARP